MNIVEQINSGVFTDPKTLLGAIVYAVVFLFFAWLFGRASHLAIHRLLTRDTHNRLDRTAVKFLAQLSRFCVYIFALISYAHLIPALQGLGTAWLASVGIISVIIGLAAQNTLGNLIAGISLLLYRPFNVGDRLQMTTPTGPETGFVESLNLGYTLLRTDDDRRVVVPNSLMASQITINLTSEDSRVICSVPIGISYDSDIDKARAILLDLADQHPQAGKARSCQVTQLGVSSVVLTLEVWCVDGPTASALKCDLLEQAKKRFDTDGIKFPSPSTTVTVKPESQGGIQN